MKPVVALVAAAVLAAVTASGVAVARSVKAPDQVAPSLPAGVVAVHLTADETSSAVWPTLKKLGWVQTNVLKVATAQGGKRVCITVYEGTLPTASLAAARKVPGVEGITPVPARP